MQAYLGCSDLGILGPCQKLTATRKVLAEWKVSGTELEANQMKTFISKALPSR